MTSSPNAFSLYKLPGAWAPWQCLFHSTPLFLGECLKKGSKTYHPQGNVVADRSINVLELSGCSISPVTRKSLLFKLSSKYQTNKMTQGHPKPMLAPLVLSVALWSLLWRAPPGRLQAWHSFSTLDCSKETQEVLDKKQMVRERKSVHGTSLLYNARHATS